MKTINDFLKQTANEAITGAQTINEAKTGTASNIEIKRWVTETKMHSNRYPVYAVFEDGDKVKHFVISGSTHDGEQMVLKLEERK